jgi:feruloyl esterase
VCFGIAFAIVFLFSRSAKAADNLDLPVVKPVMSCDQLGKVDVSQAVGAKTTLKVEELETPKGKYCKVTGNIDPTIGFEVDLPMEHWTQRFAETGCGAYCGNIRTSLSQAGTCTPALNGDLVVAGDDMGHQGGMTGPGASASNPEGAFGADPQKRIDFAYRANHVTALASKALINAYYGQPQKFSYFVGCSDGGREALTEAERFPTDFDGVAAGAPVAIINVHNSFFHSWSGAANRRADGSSILYREKLSILTDAIAKHCPTLSGVNDGVLDSPFACKFDPAWVQCKADASDTSKCLTAEEVGVVQKIYEGPQDASGKKFEISGLPVGSEKQWMLPSKNQTSQGGPGGGGMSGGSIKYLLLPEVAAESATEIAAQFTFSQEWFDKVRPMGYLYDAANTNLRPFEEHGGKLILWHGGADTSVPPAISLAYYQGVQKELGEKLTDSFLRYFLLPGVGHCGNGDGPSQIDVLTPLMAWTELKRPPEKIVVGKTAGGGGGMGPGPNIVAGGQIVNGGPGAPNAAGGPGGPGGPTAAGGPGAPAGLQGPGGFGSKFPYPMPASPTVYTRPIYPYPFIAHYTGKGDSTDAANYEPVKAPVSVPMAFTTEATKLIGPNNQKFYHVEDGKLVEEKK